MGGAKAKEVEKAIGRSSRVQTEAAKALVGDLSEVQGDRAEALAAGSTSEKAGPKI